MITEDIIIVGVQGGYLLKITDRGNTWDTTDFELEHNDHCYALDFYEDKFGAAGFESSTFFVMTKDTGRTWERIKKPEIGLNSLTFNIDDLAILNDSTIIANRYSFPSDVHHILITNDRGKTWSYYNESDNYHTNFYFYDDKTGYMGGSKKLDVDRSSIIKKTTDAGESWFKCYEDNKRYGDIYKMYVFDENNAMGVNGVEILRTTDGGDTWFNETYDQQPFPRFADMAFGDDKYGLLLSYNFYIYTNNPLIDNVEKKRNSEQDLNIYPNPAYNKIYIKNADLYSKYQIINNLGEVVKKGEEINDWIDVSDLSAGMYVVRLFNNRKKEYKSIKFIKY